MFKRKFIYVENCSCFTPTISLRSPISYDALSFWILIPLGLLQYNAQCSKIEKRKWNLEESNLLPQRPKSINGNWKCLPSGEEKIQNSLILSYSCNCATIPTLIYYILHYLPTIFRVLCDVISLSWFYWQRALTSLTFYIVLHCTLLCMLKVSY